MRRGCVCPAPSILLRKGLEGLTMPEGSSRSANQQGNHAEQDYDGGGGVPQEGRCPRRW